MRLTTRTNLAMRTLMFCGVNRRRTVRKQEIAQACNASENHLAQVINLLAQKGFITTVRGRRGGLQLNRPMEQINVGEVFRSFEGAVPLAECFVAEKNTCPLIGACRLRDALENAIEAFYDTLEGVSLEDLVSGNAELGALLELPASRGVGCAGAT